jgi:hypothetical protein
MRETSARDLLSYEELCQGVAGLGMARGAKKRSLRALFRSLEIEGNLSGKISYRELVGGVADNAKYRERERTRTATAARPWRKKPNALNDSAEDNHRREVEREIEVAHSREDGNHHAYNVEDPSAVAAEAKARTKAAKKPKGMLDAGWLAKFDATFANLNETGRQLSIYQPRWHAREESIHRFDEGKRPSDAPRAPPRLPATGLPDAARAGAGVGGGDSEGSPRAVARARARAAANGKEAGEEEENAESDGHGGWSRGPSTDARDWLASEELSQLQFRSLAQRGFHDMQVKGRLNVSHVSATGETYGRRTAQE